MNTAVITIVDQPNERLSLKVNFGKGGICDSSGAHRLSAEMLAQAIEADTEASCKSAVTELLEQIERLCSGIAHYRDTALWSEADDEELEAARALVAKYDDRVDLS